MSGNRRVLKPLARRASPRGVNTVLRLGGNAESVPAMNNLVLASALGVQTLPQVVNNLVSNPNYSALRVQTPQHVAEIYDSLSALAVVLSQFAIRIILLRAAKMQSPPPLPQAVSIFMFNLQEQNGGGLLHETQQLPQAGASQEMTQSLLQEVHNMYQTEILILDGAIRALEAEVRSLHQEVEVLQVRVAEYEARDYIKDPDSPSTSEQGVADLIQGNCSQEHKRYKRKIYDDGDTSTFVEEGTNCNLS